MKKMLIAFIMVLFLTGCNNDLMNTPTRKVEEFFSYKLGITVLYNIYLAPDTGTYYIAKIRILFRKRELLLKRMSLFSRLPRKKYFCRS